MATPARSQSAPELEAARNLIIRWDSSASEDARDRMIFDAAADREVAVLYLRAVDEIQRSLSSVALSDDSARAAGTIQLAMARLEDEFRSLLVSHSAPVEMESLLSRNSSSLSHLDSSVRDAAFGQDDQEVEEGREGEEIGSGRREGRRGDEDLREEEGSSRRSSGSYRSSYSISVREVELIPPDTVHDLRCIAERMITAGYKRECFQVYGSVRKSAVEACLRQLGVERLTIGDVHRLDWEVVETKIRRWIRAAKVCVRVLFASERRLCERIFSDLTLPDDDADATTDDDADEVCFMETVKSGAMQLFNFAEAISISRRSPEKLFKILDLHDGLSDLLPDIAVVFRSKPSESVRVQAAEIVDRLAEAARGILSEFENAVENEPSRVAVPGGTIHPLTRYVMNYLNLITEYKQTLSVLITAKPSRFPDDAHLSELELPAPSEEHPPLSLHVLWIILSLQTNLESKSEVYRDNALSHIFFMNNVHYIIQKAKGSPELGEMIGDDYLRRLKGKLRQSATGYQRAAWLRVLHCLRDEGLHVGGGFSSGISKTVLRERIKAFNAAFEEAHRVQATWLVTDSQVREELRVSISELLLPAYRSFLGRYRHHLESGRHSDAYIKYSEEDLDAALLDFFEGYQTAPHMRRRSN